MKKIGVIFIICILMFSCTKDNKGIDLDDTYFLSANINGENIKCNNGHIGTSGKPENRVGISFWKPNINYQGGTEGGISLNSILKDYSAQHLHSTFDRNIASIMYVFYSY